MLTDVIALRQQTCRGDVLTVNAGLLFYSMALIYDSFEFASVLATK